MRKSLKNYTTIRAVLAGNDWTARSLRICFLLMPWQDGIEVTDELMKATVSWEGKLNNFFLNSLHHPKGRETGASDETLLHALEKAKADVDVALCDSFNTPAVMRAISDLVTECNAAEALSDATVLAIARWITRLVTIFGLDPEGSLDDTERVGWSGLDIPAAAKPYVLPASQLRDQVRSLARSAALDHEAIAALADSIFPLQSAAAASSASKPFEDVLQTFRSDVQALAAQKAPAKDLLSLCDQLRDVHLWNLGVYLEDRIAPQPALVRPLDKLLVEARAENEAAGAAKEEAKEKAKREQEAREAARAREQKERAKIDPLAMFKAGDEFSAWDANGIPTADGQGQEVSKSRRKKLVKEWEKQSKLHKEWLATQEAE